MNYRKENKERLIKYFKEGIKDPEQQLTIGLELEHFVIDTETGNSVSYSGEKGIEAILKQIEPYFTESVYSEGHLIGLGRDNLAISIEPAAQMEVSISPQADGRRILFIYDQFMNQLLPVIKEWGYNLVTTGYQPKNGVDELELIPKNRYRFMEEYFNQIGPYGKYMMKGTAATQLSIDYYSEEDFSAKYRIAYALYPILAMLCDHVPVFEGNENKTPVMRMNIWDHVDETRVNVESFMKDGTLDFASYAEFVYSTPLIVKKEKEGDVATTKSANEEFANSLMSYDDVEHVLSMVFPMLRLKHYLEIRVADSMPIGSVYAYILLTKGLFSDITRVSAYVDGLLASHENWSRTLLAAIRQDGVNAVVGDIKVKNIVEEIYGMVIGNLEDSEVMYLEEYKKVILDKGSLLL